MHRHLRHRSCANNVGMSSCRHPIPLSSDTMEDIGRCWLSAAMAEILMSNEADFPPPSSHCQPFHPFSITWYGPPGPRASRQWRGSGRSTTFSICHESRAAHYAPVLRVRLHEGVQPCIGSHKLIAALVGAGNDDRGWACPIPACSITLYEWPDISLLCCVTGEQRSLI